MCLLVPQHQALFTFRHPRRRGWPPLVFLSRVQTSRPWCKFEVEPALSLRRRRSVSTSRLRRFTQLNLLSAHATTTIFALFIEQPLVELLRVAKQHTCLLLVFVLSLPCVFQHHDVNIHMLQCSSLSSSSPVCSSAHDLFADCPPPLCRISPAQVT
jgi:hypothetical protein